VTNEHLLFERISGCCVKTPGLQKP
jgi:hypothetical protein